MHYSEAVQGSWPELTAWKYFETDAISTPTTACDQSHLNGGQVEMIAVFFSSTALQKASVPLKSPRSQGC